MAHLQLVVDTADGQNFITPGNPRKTAVDLRNLFNGLAGGNRVGNTTLLARKGMTQATAVLTPSTIITGNTVTLGGYTAIAGLVQRASGIATLTTVLADQTMTLSGIALTAKNAPTSAVQFASKAFDNTDATAAASLGRSINGQPIVTFSTLIAGNTVTVMGITFTARAAPTLATEFLVTGGDTVAAAAAAVAINANKALGTAWGSASSSGALLIFTPNYPATFTLVGTASTAVATGYTGLTGILPVMTLSSMVATNTIKVQGVTFTCRAAPTLSTEFTLGASDTATAINAAAVITSYFAQVANRKPIVTLSTLIATNTITVGVEGGAPVTFTARAAPTVDTEFLVTGGDTLAAAAAVVAINARLGASWGRATSAAGVLTFHPNNPSTFVLIGTATTAVVSNYGIGTAFTVAAGSGVLTFTTVARAPLSLVGMAATGVLTGFFGLVKATVATSAVTICATAPGTDSNNITLTKSDTTIGFSGGASASKISGGIAVADHKFDTSPGRTDAEIGVDLARAINADSLVSPWVSATAVAATGVVTVTAWPGVLDGEAGNCFTAATSGATIPITGSNTRLTGGAATSTPFAF